MNQGPHLPETPATAFLRQHAVVFTPHVYEYVDHGGTASSSSALGVEEHAVVKTLVMEDEAGLPLIVLMHGDWTVSTKQLARRLGVKRIHPCTPGTAERHSGFQVGGTSPFGLRKAMPVYVEKSILELPRIHINGGRRGFLVGMDPRELLRVLQAVPVEAGRPKNSGKTPLRRAS